MADRKKMFMIRYIYKKLFLIFISFIIFYSWYAYIYGDIFKALCLKRTIIGRTFYADIQFQMHRKRNGNMSLAV